MPVIIDQIDLVETQPDPPRDTGSATAPANQDITARAILSLRLASQRSARVKAD
jgi:hypothetical protein